MAVSAPTDKRFRRAHAIPARRRRRVALSWKVLTCAGVLAMLALYVGYRGAERLMTSDALTVTHVTVSGSSPLSHGDVVSTLDGLRGSHMLLVSLEEWRQKVLASPWVEDAAVRRVLPGTIDVVIAERHPMGIARMGDVLYLLDQRGAIVDTFGPKHAGFDLPLIDGLADSKGAASGKPVVDAGRAALAARLFAALQRRPDLAMRVSQVDVADARDAVVMLKDDTALIRLGDDQFAERLQSYLDLAPALRDRIPQIDYVDFRFGERVYVKPVGGGSSWSQSLAGGE